MTAPPRVSGAARAVAAVVLGIPFLLAAPVPAEANPTYHPELAGHDYDSRSALVPVDVGASSPSDWRMAGREAVAKTPMRPVGAVYDPERSFVAPSAIPRLGSIGDEVAAARSHLGTIPDALEYGPNRAMLNSIDDAVASGRPLTTAERNFLDHELLEASYVGQGMTQEAAHALTLQTVPAASNYSPAVIRQFPDHFSDYYFDYWGISR